MPFSGQHARVEIVDFWEPFRRRARVVNRKKGPPEMNFELFTRPAVLLTTVVAFVAASFYFLIDAPTEAPDPGNKLASVTSLVGGLEARLAKDPDDAKGWLLLAKSHDHLGNWNAAWAAYTRAQDLGMSDEVLEIRLAANISQLMSNN